MKKSAKYGHKKAAKKAAPKKKAAKKTAPSKKAARKLAPKKVVKKRIFVIETKRPQVRMSERDLSVNAAQYLRNQTLLITFSDGKSVEVDFTPFFKKNKITYLNKYRTPSNFKKFKIEDGNVVWGKDWDLIFPVSQLYSGQIKA